MFFIALGKCFLNGIRVVNLLGDFGDFTVRYKTLVEHYRSQFPTIEVDMDGELACLKEHAEKLRSLSIVGDTVELLDEARKGGKSVLIEGANGALLDIDFGTYPYVTSSNSTVGGACTGLGLPPSAVRNVVGVVKAYQTRVGTGPFPTEQLNSVGQQLQSIGQEVGVTTGRKRRCGWLDLFLLKRTAIINGLTAIAFTKVDILDTFKDIQVAVGYKLDGKPLSSPPARAADWERVEVEYQTLSGWNSSTAAIRKFEDLPENCRNYIKFVEDFVGVPITMLGVGPTARL
ncbi:hypothetical protein L596_010974 [Steinernema carpocapsae]|uniref:Adenylosuccinate synthetase n=1 Tax=Steinernema carpocapsae TaxID=34508 RepID=A0A4U5NRB3_STECR|nr:hypothetical protein L596_010974 [Steinernema carpocapsae]